jgi:hypothetical protein
MAEEWNEGKRSWPLADAARGANCCPDALTPNVGALDAGERLFEPVPR